MDRPMRSIPWALALFALIGTTTPSSSRAQTDADPPATLGEASPAAVDAPTIDPAEVAALFAVEPPPPHIVGARFPARVRLQRGRVARAFGILGLMVSPLMYFSGYALSSNEHVSPGTIIAVSVVSPIVLGTGSIAAIVRGKRLVRSARRHPDALRR